MKILIVDDDPAIVTFLRRAAIRQGHEDIDTASSGEEALTQAIRTNYDLITLDIQMPGASGLEILSPVRNLCPHAIIAVVSAHIPDEASPEVAGSADVMIDKPIGIETLNRLLEGVARICEARAEIGLLGRVPLTVR